MQVLEQHIVHSAVGERVDLLDGLLDKAHPGRTVIDNLQRQVELVPLPCLKDIRECLDRLMEVFLTDAVAEFSSVKESFLDMSLVISEETSGAES